ncbi:uncharacterized protein LOC117108383 isoform X2 [Anneissia japonica]|nr:uncharacterized protein LOC117108383 isoform X2 [Anneissia japonica]XP_033106310.1 uncharacterized protein LOC117108383 isoform X2 [Anneissia japonica]
MVAKSLYRNFLMLAIDALEPEIAKIFVDRGIDINHKCWGVNGKQSARDLAVENCLDEVVLIIDNRLPAPMQLFSAVVDGRASRTKQLLSHIDTDVNMKVNQYGEKTPGSSAYTLLMIAIKHNHPDVANLLIEQSIDLTFQHQEWERLNPESDEVLVASYTALELAIQRDMHDVVKMIKNQQLKNARPTDIETNGSLYARKAKPTQQPEDNQLTTLQISRDASKQTALPRVEQDRLISNPHAMNDIKKASAVFFLFGNGIQIILLR